MTVAYNLLRLNPMGVVGWSVTALFIVACVWITGRTLTSTI
ncbi:hypothetical protein ACF05L_16460 [Streptomyces bobili]